MIETFLVKICGLTTRGDLQTAVDAGAGAIGFNFYRRSPRYITFAKAQELSAQVNGPYLRVGVFVHPSTDDLEAAPVDVVQIHGNVPDCIPPRLRVWRATTATANGEALDTRWEAYLLDTPSSNFGGTGVPLDWRSVANFPHRFILAGGLDADNVAEAIRVAQPWGVDACSRLESTPGRKDERKVERFIAAALAAAAQTEITR